ncbi:MAG: YSC84-related protein [Pseudomonadales bacterium]|nr:YSC84-related protein [Pseudomonadales bacterium]
MKLSRKLAVVALTLALSACASSTVDQRRQEVLNMREDVLQKFDVLKPDVRAQINHAVGYGVFSNANLTILFGSVGGGRGVVRDNRTGLDTFMKMGELGVGLGLGIKDFRIVMVYHTAEVLERFKEYGFAFSAQGDAAATIGDQGGALGGEAPVENITVYQITENGLALQITVKGTKFWLDEDLN